MLVVKIASKVTLLNSAAPSIDIPIVALPNGGKSDLVALDRGLMLAGMHPSTSLMDSLFLMCVPYFPFLLYLLSEVSSVWSGEGRVGLSYLLLQGIWNWKRVS